MHVIRTLAMASVAAIATAVSATPIVTTWQYSIASSFTAATYSDGSTPAFGAPGSCPNASTTCNSPNGLSWGTNLGNGQSGLTIVNTQPPPGVVNTDTNNILTVGEIGPGPIFTHLNHPIGDPVLLSAVVSSTLTLQALAPPGPVLPPAPPVVFNILFNETPNFADPTLCLIAPTNPANPCPDIFVLQGNFNVGSFVYDTDGPGPATPDTYFIQIFPLAGGDLQVLPAAACASVGAAPGCVGFITQENADSAVQFGFAITAQPFGVPEPGVLALMAFGLVGLGFAARRRQA